MLKRAIRILLLVVVGYCVIIAFNIRTYIGKHIPPMVSARVRWEEWVQPIQQNSNRSAHMAEKSNISTDIFQKDAIDKGFDIEIIDNVVESYLNKGRKSIEPKKVEKPFRARHPPKKATPVVYAKIAKPSDVVKTGNVVKRVIRNELSTRNITNPFEECSHSFINDSNAFCNKTVPQWKELINRFPKLPKGGHYLPRTCVPQHHVAIIVPYRDRVEHLKLFLQHMHSYLQTKEVEYTIFIVEQDNRMKFKKGLLMNAGFLEVSKRTSIKCFMFHDVDMLPLDYRIDYSCTKDTMWHPSIYIRQYNFRKPYGRYCGGVTAFNKQIFNKVNGFSNLYWGWGGEDDDMHFRLKAKKILVEEPEDELRYESWSHPRQEEFANRRDFIMRAAERMHLDGLNSADYQVLQTKLLPLYTWIYVSANGNIASFDNLTAIHSENWRDF